ncbi:hypothetical protein RDMS_01595 [Deinococcus sp. RL]|uniref:hypothetical protein n=1 Tax=Deinococcus sp. RL TaxID=1489678 RepID=UPI0004DA0F5C|nr:hypothetical protein [Deinococcus sp. RL]KEF35475.1 hypothetical protein RDMS_01595 [Deinococcus sp. RL]
MDPAQYLALRVPPSALGMSEGEHAGLVDALLDEAATLSESETAQRWWALGELHHLEYLRLRHELSAGSGAEGSFSRSEISARMAAAKDDRDTARAEFTRLTTPTPQPSKATRGSGSVGIVFEG